MRSNVQSTIHTLLIDSLLKTTQEPKEHSGWHIIEASLWIRITPLIFAGRC